MAARPSRRSSTRCPSASSFTEPFSGITGQIYTFRSLREDVRDPRELIWRLRASGRPDVQVEVDIRGRKDFVHHLPYLKTDCSGQFEVANDSLAQARMVLHLPGKTPEELTTDTGAALEMVGNDLS